MFKKDLAFFSNFAIYFNFYHLFQIQINMSSNRHNERQYNNYELLFIQCLTLVKRKFHYLLQVYKKQEN